MLGFGSLGQFALGQISSDQFSISVNLNQAAGAGVAGTLTGKVSSFTFSGVTGTGVAGIITAAVAAAQSGAVGVGVAGAINSSVTIAVNGAAGIGQAGLIVPSIASLQSSAVGTGVAGSIAPAASVVLPGVSGTGIARALSFTTAMTVNGVSGTGVARDITPSLAAPQIGATGVGTAGALNASSIAVTVAGVAGIGIAGVDRDQVAVVVPAVTGTGTAGILGRFDVAMTLPGAAGIGVARGLVQSPASTVPSAVATGVAGGMAGPNVVPNAPFFGGFDGLVSGRFALGQIRQAVSDGGISIRITLPSAVGIGTAGSINVSGFLRGASGIGVTNWVAQPYTPYTFVELLHFDAYPVRYLPDMTSVSVVVASAVGGGVAGQIRTMVSGGGTSSGASRKKTGFEPIKKLPPSVIVAERKPVPLPPFRQAPALAPDNTSPFDLVDRDLIPEDLLGLQDQIHTAQDIADIQRYLRGLDQDDQDAADIADVLAILDLE